jgi:hypothetical protein
VSDTLPPDAPAAPAPSRITSLFQSIQGAPVVSFYSLTLLLVALVFAYYVKNETLLTTLVAVIATNATTVVGFYVGSSASSQTKDRTISNQLPTPPPAPLVRHQ